MLSVPLACLAFEKAPILCPDGHQRHRSVQEHSRKVLKAYNINAMSCHSSKKRKALLQSINQAQAPSNIATNAVGRPMLNAPLSLSPDASSTAAATLASNVHSPNAKCYFLSIPLEIRLNIYRLLLLEPSSTFLESTPWRDVHYPAGYGLGSYMAGGDNTIVHRAGESEDSPRSETWGTFLERPVRSMKSRAPQRIPVILQTNRQIYTEASPLLYSGLQMVVKLEDALKRRGSRFLMIESREVGCPYSYCRCDSDWRGAVSPYIFTRFQKVRYEAGFDLWADSAPPNMYIGKDLKTLNADETRLITYFKCAQACKIPALYVIQEFVDMLSKSPLINILEVALSVKVPANYLDSDSSSNRVFDYGAVKKEEAVDLRAYELFLESGVLEPLKKLTNVKRFAFDFALVDHLPQRKLFHPKQKHLDIVDDLKATIERNWVVKPAHPWQQCPNRKKDKRNRDKKRKERKKKAWLSIGASGGHASG